MMILAYIFSYIPSNNLTARWKELTRHILNREGLTHNGIYHVFTAPLFGPLSGARDARPHSELTLATVVWVSSDKLGSKSHYLQK